MRNKEESREGIRLCGNACVICGWNKTNTRGMPLVEGAHVKPFINDKSCDNRNNIIALCPNHHTMFDNFLFYIDPNTYIAKFFYVDDEFNNVDLSNKIKYVRVEYLAYRKYLYEEENQNIFSFS